MNEPTAADTKATMDTMLTKSNDLGFFVGLVSFVIIVFSAVGRAEWMQVNPALLALLA